MNGNSRTISVQTEAHSYNISVVYLAKYGDNNSRLFFCGFCENYHSCDPLKYLQLVRQDCLEIKLCKFKNEYLSYNACFAKALADKVKSSLSGSVPDAICEIPSSRCFNKTYADAINQLFPGADILSEYICRYGLVKAGDNSISAAEVERDMYVCKQEECKRRLSGINTIIFVDDIYASGKTINAVIKNMSKYGLSNEANLMLAVPLVIESGFTKETLI
jgi:hypothetical protein